MFSEKCNLGKKKKWFQFLSDSLKSVNTFFLVMIYHFAFPGHNTSTIFLKTVRQFITSK